MYPLQVARLRRIADTDSVDNESSREGAFSWSVSFNIIIILSDCKVAFSFFLEARRRLSTVVTGTSREVRNLFL